MLTAGNTKSSIEFNSLFHIANLAKSIKKDKTGMLTSFTETLIGKKATEWILVEQYKRACTTGFNFLWQNVLK